ncbi:MAG: AAA family ATPase, partial [Gemmatimonadaceae bacterium]
LVSLYELIADGDEWLFTMELVDGVSFLRYVRPPTSGSTARADDPSDDEPELGELDVGRLRHTLRQLAEGVQALHTAGKVHRDLKPSNTLVAATGRVVVLDFGISGDLRPEALHITTGTIAPGTAHYMSPEQAAGEMGTAASDWYSVGVMLFEALTGTLPFQGLAMAVMYRKQGEDPPSVASLAPGAPPDLAQLCDTLLARDPAGRPDGAAVLRRVGASESVLPPADAAPAREQGSFVGREAHLQTLEEAFLATRAGRSASVYVHGPSGMGKSTVVEHFLNRLMGERRAVILTGRCYDRESMPYKAFDGVIDSLTRYLRTLPASEVKALLPADVLTIARLFPVLQRVGEIENAPPLAFDIPDPLELRRRAIAALRELLGRLATHVPLVVHIDDLHWADADSIALGQVLLRRPGAPPLLLITSFRSEELESKSFLRSLLAMVPGSQSRRELAVGPLTDEEARALASALLAPAGAGVGRLIDAIVREADGSPFFIEQLARYALENEEGASAGIGLGEMLEARVRRLPEGARPVLQTLAVAGRPVDFEAVHRAAGLSGDPRALVAALRVAHMVRPSGSADRIELYHDRIREALMERLDADEINRIHRRLAEALTETAADDPETLFEHYLGAGDRAHAAAFAAKAAERAAAALAFDRAVSLFQYALDLDPPTGTGLAHLHANLGEALANAGRPGKAADAFLRAADEASVAADAIEYQRRAAEQLLIGGHNERGLQVTRALLRNVGLRMPPNPARALVSLLLRRAQLRLRGLSYVERAASSIPERELLRMDICWACALGLTMVDYIVAAYFQTRYLLLALDAGEPYRIARALSFEAGFAAANGVRAAQWTEDVLARAQGLADKLGSPRELGLAAVTAGSAACMLGDFPRSAELCSRAERILRERCTGVQWELTTCQIFLLTAFAYLGKVGEVVRRMPLLLEAAHDRGNLFEAIELRTRQNFYWLVTDAPEDGRREVAYAMARWTRRGFYRQHYNALLALTQIDLYVGDPTAAWSRLREQWPALSRSLLLRVQLLRCESWHLHARCAIAAAAGQRDGEPELRTAERLAVRIARERAAWAAPFAPLLRAGVAAVRGDTAAAAAELATAAEGFDAAHMALYAAVSRRQWGQLLGGDQGRQLTANADAFMRAQGIERPERIAAVLAPGFGG